jgi:hypothetical protein
MAHVYQWWWRICREINVFPRFEYHMFYVLYSFVTYLLTFPRVSVKCIFTACPSVIGKKAFRYRNRISIHSKLSVFQNVIPCSLLHIYRNFEDMCCLHQQNKKFSEELIAYFPFTTN